MFNRGKNLWQDMCELTSLAFVVGVAAAVGLGTAVFILAGVVWVVRAMFGG